MEKKKRILLKTVGTIGAASVGIISAISIPKTINTIKNQIIKSDENVVVGDTFILDVQDLTSAGFNSDDVMSGNLKFTIQTLDLDSGTGTVSLADNTQSVYVNESWTIGQYTFSATNLIIPDKFDHLDNDGITRTYTITKIDNYAFGWKNKNGTDDKVDKASTLTGSITFPNTITSIGIAAFYKFNGTQINFGNQLEEILDYAFYDSTQITTLFLPASVKHVWPYAFATSSRTLKLHTLTFGGYGKEIYFHKNVFANRNTQSGTGANNGLKIINVYTSPLTPIYPPPLNKSEPGWCGTGFLRVDNTLHNLTIAGKDQLTSVNFTDTQNADPWYLGLQANGSDRSNWQTKLTALFYLQDVDYTNWQSIHDQVIDSFYQGASKHTNLISFFSFLNNKALAAPPVLSEYSVKPNDSPPSSWNWRDPFSSTAPVIDNSDLTKTLYFPHAFIIHPSAGGRVPSVTVEIKSNGVQQNWIQGSQEIVTEDNPGDNQYININIPDANQIPTDLDYIDLELNIKESYIETAETKIAHFSMILKEGTSEVTPTDIIVKLNAETLTPNSTKEITIRQRSEGSDTVLDLSHIITSNQDGMVPQNATYTYIGDDPDIKWDEETTVFYVDKAAKNETNPHTINFKVKPTGYDTLEKTYTIQIRMTEALDLAMMSWNFNEQKEGDYWLDYADPLHQVMYIKTEFDGTDDVYFEPLTGTASSILKNITQYTPIDPVPTGEKYWKLEFKDNLGIYWDPCSFTLTAFCGVKQTSDYIQDTINISIYGHGPTPTRPVLIELDIQQDNWIYQTTETNANQNENIITATVGNCMPDDVKWELLSGNKYVELDFNNKYYETGNSVSIPIKFKDNIGINDFVSFDIVIRAYVGNEGNVSQKIITFTIGMDVPPETSPSIILTSNTSKMNFYTHEIATLIADVDGLDLSYVDGKIGVDIKWYLPSEAQKYVKFIEDTLTINPEGANGGTISIQLEYFTTDIPPNYTFSPGITINAFPTSSQPIEITLYNEFQMPNNDRKALLWGIIAAGSLIVLMSIASITAHVVQEKKKRK